LELPVGFALSLKPDYNRPMKNRWQRFLFFAVVVSYLLAGISYASITPAWQNPDEPAHFNYISALAGHFAFPELVAGCYDQNYLSTLIAGGFPETLPVDSICYEFHQPPLYYALVTPIFLVGNGQLIILRIISVLLGAGTVILSFHTGRTVFTDYTQIGLGAMALTAFVPMHTAILASVNNDALAGLLFAGILLLLMRRLRPDGVPTTWDNLLLGVLLGLVLVTKVTVYIAVPLVGLTLLFLTFVRRHQLLVPAITVFGIAALIALPWYIRNATLYGGFDVLGLQRHDAVVVGQLRTSDFLAETGGSQYLVRFATTTFQSFWGQFGWMAVPMDPRTYRLLVTLTLAAGSGLVAYLVSQWRAGIAPAQKQMLALLGLSTAFTMLAYMWYNLSFVQFQGRYLFTAIVPLAIFGAIGLHEASRPRRQLVLTSGLLLAMVVVAWGGGNPDWKGGLIVGIFALLSGARILRPQWSDTLSAMLILGVYGGLAVLTLAGPFWFVLPYL
jgi:4-amino-4-deoxy-L-arabinose transferase-like glycosyltransferase